MRWNNAVQKKAIVLGKRLGLSPFHPSIAVTPTRCDCRASKIQVEIVNTRMKSEDWCVWKQYEAAVYMMMDGTGSGQLIEHITRFKRRGLTLNIGLDALVG